MLASTFVNGEGLPVVVDIKGSLSWTLVGSILPHVGNLSFFEESNTLKQQLS